ncbi:MAG: anti-sigma-I factor RsgI family protein [Bacillota bacterium]
MVYKGLVIGIENDFAIVMTKNMTYQKVIKKDGLTVGKEILFVQDDVYREETYSYKKLGSYAAVILILFLSITMLTKLNVLNPISSNAAAIISVDINPSLEFEIDENYMVLGITPMNNDGKALIKDTNLIDISMEEALQTVLHLARENGYLTKEKNKVLISSVTLRNEDTALETAIEEKVEKTIASQQEFQEVEVFFVKAEKEDVEEAREQKISIGKYEVYKEAKNQNPEIDIEKVKGMKVNDVVNNGLGKLKKMNKKVPGGQVQIEGPNPDNKDIDDKGKEIKEEKENPGKSQAPGQIKKESTQTKKEDNKKQEKKIPPGQEKKIDQRNDQNGEQKKEEMKKDDEEKLESEDIEEKDEAKEAEEDDAEGSKGNSNNEKKNDDKEKHVEKKEKDTKEKKNNDETGKKN